MNVEQYTQEREIGWPYGDHKIHPVVNPLPKEWNEYLGRKLSEQIKQSFDWINNL